MQRTLPTAIALTALSLVSLASEPVQGTVTPRQLLERAAYAENNQHDLAAAEKGYREASAAAAKAGDAAVAKEADAALERVLGRRGQGAAPQAELPKAALDILCSGRDLELANAFNAALDLAMYGDRVLPLLERMVLLPPDVPVEFGGMAFRNAPVFGAIALIAIDSPRAREALAKGLNSGDPLLRRSIVSKLQSNQIELLIAAVGDSVAAVRAEAVSRLSKFRDPRAKDVMVRAARDGDGNALSWLCENAPRAAFELVESGAMSGTTLNDVRDALRLAWRKPGRFEDLAFLLEKAGADEPTASVARHCAEMVIWGQSSNSSGSLQLSRPTQERIHEIVREVPRTFALVLLQGTDSDLCVDTALAVAHAGKQPFDSELDVLVANLLAPRNNKSAITTSERLLELYAAIAPRTDFSNPNSGNAARAISRQIVKASEAPGEEAVFAQFARLLGLAERNLLAEDAKNWCGLVLKRHGSREQPLPESYRVVAEWLMGLPESTMVNSGLRLFDATNDPTATERALALVEGSDSMSGSDTAGRVFHAASQRHGKDTTALLWNRIAASRDGGVALQRAHRLAYLVLWLPSREVSAEFVRRAMREGLPPALCGVMLECLLENENASEPVLALAVELVPVLARENPNLTTYAIRAFREALYEPAIPLLGEALRDRNAHVRSEAQDTFAAFRVQREALEEFQAWMNISKEQRSTTTELVKLLASPQRDVVLGAVKALGALRAPTALPELVKLLERDDAELKQAVLAAIDACGGAPAK